MTKLREPGGVDSPSGSRERGHQSANATPPVMAGFSKGPMPRGCGLHRYTSIHDHANDAIMQTGRLPAKPAMSNCDFRKPWLRPSGNSGRVLMGCEWVWIDAQGQ
jgi:hypothetical protein